MNEKERKKRLDKIREEKIFSEVINYQDLLLLLQEDSRVQELVYALAHQHKATFAPSEEEALQSQPLPLPERSFFTQPEPEPKLARELSPAEIFYQELQGYRSFLYQVQDDLEFSTAWLRPEESDAQALVRLIALASQWDNLLELWDTLASRCKKATRGLTPKERELLETTLGCYNLTLHTRQAQLIWPDPTARFDHNQHTRGTAQGERITAIWLPGLNNAAGKIQKKPLVATS